MKKTNNNHEAIAARQKLLLRNSSPSSDSTEGEIKYVQNTLVLLIERENEKALDLDEQARRCRAHAQHASRTLTAFSRLVKKGALALCGVLIASSTIMADDHDRDRHDEHESHNYIIERQTSGQVEGVPTSRRIIGKREIDIYSNGLMFEGNNVVGVEPKR